MKKVYIMWNWVSSDDHMCLVGVFKTLDAAKRHQKDLDFKPSEYMIGSWEARYPRRADGTYSLYRIIKMKVRD